MGEEAYERAKVRQTLAYAALNEMSKRRAQEKLDRIIRTVFVMGALLGFAAGAIIVLIVWAVWG